MDVSIREQIRGMPEYSVGNVNFAGYREGVFTRLSRMNSLVRTRSNNRCPKSTFVYSLILLRLDDESVWGSGSGILDVSRPLFLIRVKLISLQLTDCLFKASLRYESSSFAEQYTSLVSLEPTTFKGFSSIPYAYVLLRRRSRNRRSL